MTGAAAARDRRIPVVVVTGFLGSGKTTLLSQLLADPAIGNVAVLVNELGEVSLDHALVRRVDERTVALSNGCLCCTLRDDLAESLRDLQDLADRGEIDPLERIVVETTGLAEPAPILHTILADPIARERFRTETVVTTVDAATGQASLDRHPESVRQAGAADRLLITKGDLAGERAVGALEARLRGINPGAPTLRVVHGRVALADLLTPGRAEPTRPEEVAAWLAATERANGGGEAGPGRGAADAALPPRGEAHAGAPQPHSHDVEAHAMTFDAPLDWTAFGVWLTMLLAHRGEDVLRVKGLLDVGEAGPVVVNGVQHVVHPPQHLDAWPTADRRSRVVFVARGIRGSELEASLDAFQRAAAEI